MFPCCFRARVLDVLSASRRQAHDSGRVLFLPWKKARGRDGGSPALNVALRSRLDQNRNVGTCTTRANMTVLLPGIKTFSAILKILSTCPLRICNNALLADGNQHHVFGMSAWTVNFLQ